MFYTTLSVSPWTTCEVRLCVCEGIVARRTVGSENSREETSQQRVQVRGFITIGLHASGHGTFFRKAAKALPDFY